MCTCLFQDIQHCFFLRWCQYIDTILTAAFEHLGICQASVVMFFSHCIQYSIYRKLYFPKYSIVSLMKLPFYYQLFEHPTFGGLFKRNIYNYLINSSSLIENVRKLFFNLLSTALISRR
jgi:hypothetical protein